MQHEINVYRAEDSNLWRHLKISTATQALSLLSLRGKRKKTCTSRERHDFSKPSRSVKLS